MNKQIIGFDRELQLAWLDLTAGLAQEHTNVQTIRQRLQNQLAAEIPGQEACRKTITLLTRLWVRVPPEHRSLQTEAFQLLPALSPPERLMLHWGLSLLAYPFFFDVVSIIGNLLNLQGQFESSQVRRRLQESWGQRTTLDRAANRVIQTLVMWAVVTPSSQPRSGYHRGKVINTDNSRLGLWVLECTLRGFQQSVINGGMAAVPLTTLIKTPATFPFEMTHHATDVRQSTRFEVNYQGLNLEYVMLHSNGTT